jgi:hypothetical protein
MRFIAWISWELRSEPGTGFLTSEINACISSNPTRLNTPTPLAKPPLHPIHSKEPRSRRVAPLVRAATNNLIGNDNQAFPKPKLPLESCLRVGCTARSQYLEGSSPDWTSPFCWGFGLKDPVCAMAILRLNLEYQIHFQPDVPKMPRGATRWNIPLTQLKVACSVWG